MSDTASRPASTGPSAFEPPAPAAELAGAVAAGRIVMGCDAPPAGARDLPLPLPITIVGWAYSRSGVEAVQVIVDGGVVVPARLGMFRDDVAAGIGEPAAARSGFSARLDGLVCPPGPHELAIVAHGREGAPVGVRVTVLAEPEAGQVNGAAPHAPAAADPDEATGGLDNDGERYVPEVHRGTYTEAEHEARYNWAAPLAAGRDVLDAACGVGWGTARLARAGAQRAVGVDLDEPALQSGRERAGDAAEFVHGDLLELPFEDATFDLVVCFEAIEHVEDPGRALDELRRVLRPDGLLAVSSPNRGVYPAGNPFHLHELTSTELEAELRKRFGAVAIYRQQTHLGALLGGDAEHAAHDPSTPVSARLYKAAGGAPGDELYTIGLAGEGELPAMEAVATLGASPDAARLEEELARLRDDACLNDAKAHAAGGELRQARAHGERLEARGAQLERREGELYAEVERLRVSLSRAEQQRDAAQRWLDEHRRSLSWRLTAPLRLGKRLSAHLRRPR